MSQASETPRRGSNGGTVHSAPTPSGGPRRSRRTGIVVGLGLVAALGFAAVKVGSMLNHISGSGHGGALSVIDSITNPAGQFPGKDRVNIVLIGKDYNRYVSKSNRKLNGMPFTKGSRADSIVVLSVDLKDKTLSALSVPRDTRVTAPDGHTGKINGTEARGGPKLLMQTLGELLGVTPDYYVSLKPDGVKNMVNSLGGVDVVALDDMNYDDNWGQLHIHITKGSHHINGDEAVGFTRFREIKPGTPHSKEEGDMRRMARQQMVIRAMTAEAKKPQNWLRADQIVNAGLEQVTTDLSRQQVFALGALLKSVQPDQIQSAALEGHGTPPHGGPYFFFPDQKKTEALVAWLLKGDESAANRLTVVAVENGTQIPGLARRVADVLREQGGFDAKSDGNTPGDTQSPGGVSETRIVYDKAAVQARAQRIAQLLGGGKLEKQVPTVPANGSGGSAALPASSDPNAPDVTVVLGKDLAANFAERSAKL